MPAPRRRLRALQRALQPQPAPAAAAAATEVVASKQGLGVRALTQPPSFTPAQHDEAVAFFREFGYVSDSGVAF